MNFYNLFKGLKKINIIDFIIVISIVLGLPILFVGHKIFIRQAKKIDVMENLPKKEYTVDFVPFTCRFIKLSPEIASKVSIGDKDYNDNGMLIGEIIDVGSVNNYKYSFDLGSPEIIKRETKNLKELVVRLNLKPELRNNNKIFYRNEQITSEKTFKFKTDEYEVEVEIVFDELEKVNINKENNNESSGFKN